MVPVDSDGISRVPPYSGYLQAAAIFHLQDFHLLRLIFPNHSARSCHTFLQSYNPKVQALWFGLFPVRSPLLRKSIFLSFPMATEMFQFTTSTAS